MNHNERGVSAPKATLLQQAEIEVREALPSSVHTTPSRNS